MFQHDEMVYSMKIRSRYRIVGRRSGQIPSTSVGFTLTLYDADDVRITVFGQFDC